MDDVALFKEIQRAVRGVPAESGAMSRAVSRVRSLLGEAPAPELIPPTPELTRKERRSRDRLERSAPDRTEAAESGNDTP